MAKTKSGWRAVTSSKWDSEADSAAREIVGLWALENDVNLNSLRNRATLSFVRRLVKLAFLRGATLALDSVEYLLTPP